MEIENKKLIEAIESGNYKVSLEEPNNINKCKKYDGTEFYCLTGDSEKFGVSAGYCTVKVLGKTFECDLSNGDWQDEDENEVDDKVIEALEAADGIIFGEMLETDDEWEVYCKATGTDSNLPYYNWFDEDCPRDIDNLGFSDFTIPCTYGIVMAHGASSEPVEFDCTISDKDLYKIYRYLDENGYDFSDSEEEAELSDENIRSRFPDIYESIMNQVQDNASEEQDYDGDFLRFGITITKELLEDTLGSNPDAEECW